MGLDVGNEPGGESLGLPFDPCLVAVPGQEPCDELGRAVGREGSETLELRCGLRIVLEDDVRDFVTDDRVTSTNRSKLPLRIR